MLFVFIVLSHAHLQVAHFNVTGHPTSQWTAQEIVEAVPWDTAPRFLLRGRDVFYGERFQRRVQSMGIEEALTAYRSPWQNALRAYEGDTKGTTNLEPGFSIR